MLAIIARCAKEAARTHVLEQVAMLQTFNNNILAIAAFITRIDGTTLSLHTGCSWRGHQSRCQASIS